MTKATLLAVLLAAPLAARAQAAGAPAVDRPAPDLAAAQPAASATPQAAGAAPLVQPAPAPAAKEKHGFFPIWGDKVRAKGFELPEPLGFMVSYYNQQSDIEITNLKLGFNGGPQYDASGLIKIPSARTEAAALSLRPNVMIFPFFSVYAVYAVGDTATNVNVQLGDATSFDTLAQSGAQVTTIGGTFQLGYKGFFGVADFNASVSDVDRLADAVGANMLSFRLGYNRKLNARGRGIALWAGTAGQVLEVETKGSVRLGDVIAPPSGETIAGAQAKCDAIPITDAASAARKAACNAIVDKLANFDPNTTVEYSLDKKPAGVWNMILGAQLALDRAWQFRFETTFLNGRTTFLAATEYRFDIL
jgi:hypothetical protein